MLQRFIKSFLNGKHHYSSSDYKKRSRYRYDSKYHGHSQYGHHYYKRKYKSRSFFSSFYSS